MNEDWNMGTDEGLFRVITKDGAHLNQKVQADGSVAAIQFDAENDLQGPVNLVKVDESDLPTKTIYVNQNRSISLMLFENVAAPIISVLVERATNAGINAITSFMHNKVIPAAKVKIEKVRVSQAAKKQKKAEERKSTELIVAKETNLSTECAAASNDQEKNYHTPEEVEQIIKIMQNAALCIAAGLKELSNTVVINTDNPELALETQEHLKELTTENVRDFVNFMLLDENRDQLDQATQTLFESLRSYEFCVIGDCKASGKHLANEDDYKRSLEGIDVK